MVSAFCVPNQLTMHNTYIGRGYGNGYLVFNRSHPLHSKHYDHINDNNYMLAHGGWTYSKSAKEIINHLDRLGAMPVDSDELLIDENDWVIGFDTAHDGDNLVSCSKEFVIDHIVELKKYYSKLENFI